MDREALLERVVQAYRVRFGRPPDVVVFAPGRVNLIGEHTDYNEGFVLPMTVPLGIAVAAGHRWDTTVHVVALDVREEARFSLYEQRRLPGWRAYVQGMLWALREGGYGLGGWQGVFGGNLPIGAGLSSSAALTLSIARTAAALFALPWSPRTMALLAQKAENEWVGVACGIMDQMAVAYGQKDHVLLLDCRTLDLIPVLLPQHVMVMVLDTGTRRTLETSVYNQRRAECAEAAQRLRVRALRDVSMEMLQQAASSLPAPLYRRARHVVTENQRVLEAVEAFRRGDVARAGALFNASHASLREDFEVTGPALDAIVACAQEAPGCYGARMTGAGFAGCAVALVAPAHQEAFIRHVTACYRKATGMDAQIYPARPVDGVREVEGYT